MKLFLLPFIAFSLLLLHLPGFSQIYHREDTIFIRETPVLPIINATIDDAWDLAEWRNIDQIWMPWNNLSQHLNQEAGLKLWAGPDDFSGRFKVMWSSETNLLYFLVEIVDDVFVDGYVFPNGGYHNFDIVEVFIDEDRSGGPHVFDGVLYPGNTNCPTCNAENAFAYHIAANAKDDGVVQNEMHALDMAGHTWNIIRDYADHFPEFAMKREGTNYIWEFSLLVHNDTYNHTNQEASIVTLEEGKIMGLSMAYCDNDDINENPIRRDHFFGSVYVPLSAHNSHWINADWFGAAKLVSSDFTSSVPVISPDNDLRVYYSSGEIHTIISDPQPGEVTLRIFNLMGSEVYRQTFTKPYGGWFNSFNSGDLPHGIYIIQLGHAGRIAARKVNIW